MNVFAFTGNIGGEPELRHTPAGKPVLSFSVAVRSGWGDREETTWVRVSTFRGAEKLHELLCKGMAVAVDGELTLREFSARDGSIGKSLEVVANNVTLLSRREAAPEPARSPQRGAGGRTGTSAPPSRSAAPVPSGARRTAEPAQSDWDDRPEDPGYTPDDDIPF